MLQEFELDIERPLWAIGTVSGISGPNNEDDEACANLVELGVLLMSHTAAGYRGRVLEPTMGFRS